MCADKVLQIIESLNSEDRLKVLALIKEKYDLMDRLPRDAFVVGESYNFWNNKEDDIYDNPKRK
ncbi:MAG TPA: hypothetical protein GXZ70_00065 [Clostridiales bacterium]|jgi:hypothetical protein|nr:hypothetical protein [Clostridiales bacterium]